MTPDGQHQQDFDQGECPTNDGHTSTVQETGTGAAGHGVSPEGVSSRERMRGVGHRTKRDFSGERDLPGP